MELTKEHHLAFPPSANWYNFNASDLSLENKYFAYGAKNTVCVFEVVGLKFILVKRFYGHVNTSRISSIQFGKHASIKNTLVSGCTCGDLHLGYKLVVVSFKIHHCTPDLLTTIDPSPP